MPPVFLIGGGRDDDAAVRAAHAPFVEACDGGPILCVCEDDSARWRGNLAIGGARDVTTVMLDAGRPDPAGFAGIYVAGGLTPAYRETLEGLKATVPYCGFSAGAAIAAGSALIGGWKIGDRQVCDEDFGEELDQVEPLPGLGLVPFAVDVHATQWGTATRLIHAVRGGLAPDGWAVDEGTVLVFDGDRVVGVEGLGCAYRVSGGGSDLRLAVSTA